MTSNTDQIKLRVASKKPNLSPKSQQIYASLINQLLKRKNPNYKSPDFDWIDNHADDVSNFITENYREVPLGTTKTLYSALYGITANQVYHEYMLKISNEASNQLSKNEKTERQEKNWVSMDEIQTVFDRIETMAKPYLLSKEPLTGLPLQIVQQYVILALTSGLFIAPRRSQDWTEMRINGVPKSKKDITDYNYISGNTFHFVKYKTAATYGEQTVEIPKKLKTIITKWKKLNPYNDMLVNTDGTQMGVVRLSQVLNKIFEKQVSTSLLRHIYISDKLKSMPTLQDMKQTADNMGHSVMMQLEYAKR
jgi:gas vesicle protein